MDKIQTNKPMFLDKIQIFPAAKLLHFLIYAREFAKKNDADMLNNTKRGAFWPLFVLFSFCGILRALRELRR